MKRFLAAISKRWNFLFALAGCAVFLRRSFAPAADILSAEAELIELTRETGTQTQIPTAGVTGPRSAAPYFAEVDE
ncbi:hypothetical protein [Burkholderia glumae]|uniref:hypothetical protein n=1 Tax=Burkholderia glumae TaxID=337 RepID=UPI002151686F|nr:hypothetical protein [Burkholderia glumae]